MSWLSDLWQNADKVSLNFVDKDGTKQSYVIDFSKNRLTNTMNGQIQDFFHYGSIEDKKQILKLYANKIDLTDIFIGFLGYFPWGSYRTSPAVLKIIDKRIEKDEAHKKSLLAQWKSDKYCTGTINDLFDAIDECIEECKLDTDYIKELIDTGHLDGKLSNTFYRHVWPVYISLLQKWYTHADLIQ